MVEEHLAGTARSETAWEQAAEGDWSEEDGIWPARLFRRLRTLARAHGADSQVLLAFGDPAGEAPVVPPGVIVVLLIDSATYDGTALAPNLGHYVVAHSFVDVARPMTSRPRAEHRRRAAVYHDPQTGPDQVWAWSSLWATAHAAVSIQPQQHGTRGAKSG